MDLSQVPFTLQKLGMLTIYYEFLWHGSNIKHHPTYELYRETKFFQYGLQSKSFNNIISLLEAHLQHTPMNSPLHIIVSHKLISK